MTPEQIIADYQFGVDQYRRIQANIEERRAELAELDATLVAMFKEISDINNSLQTSMAYMVQWQEEHREDEGEEWKNGLAPDGEGQNL